MSVAILSFCSSVSSFAEMMSSHFWDSLMSSCVFMRVP